MDEKTAARMERLNRLAQEDLFYQTWSKYAKPREDAYREFFRAQPEDIQLMLYDYVDCCRVAQQRVIELACRHMIFPEEEP